MDSQLILPLSLMLMMVVRRMLLTAAIGETDENLLDAVTVPCAGVFAAVDPTDGLGAVALFVTYHVLRAHFDGIALNFGLWRARAID